MNHSTPISNIFPQFGVQAHPYYNTYTDFQKPYSMFTPASYGNNPSTSAENYSGEFPLNSGYRYAAGFLPSERYMDFFSDKSIDFMQRMITWKLRGVHPDGKNIIVPKESIYSVADSIYQNTGQSSQVMQEMVINFIVDSLKTEWDTTAKNNSYSAWVQKYDQETGLKQFNDVKLNNKMRSAYMQIRY
jgi:hypothetical protein